MTHYLLVVWGIGELGWTQTQVELIVQSLIVSGCTP